MSVMGFERTSDLLSSSLYHWTVLSNCPEYETIHFTILNPYTFWKVWIYRGSKPTVTKTYHRWDSNHPAHCTGSLDHRASLTLSWWWRDTLYYIKPLHILKIMHIQGFETRCKEKVSSMGFEPRYNRLTLCFDHWAIISQSMSGKNYIIYPWKVLFLSAIGWKHPKFCFPLLQLV